MGEESDLYLRSKEKVEFLIHKQEAEFQEKEQFYEKKLKEEKQMYAQKVSEVGKLKELYKEAKKLEKELNESQKENVVLREKLKRQEAFLKRKILDDKNSSKNIKVGNHPSPPPPHPSPPPPLPHPSPPPPPTPHTSSSPPPIPPTRKLSRKRKYINYKETKTYKKK